MKRKILITLMILVGITGVACEDLTKVTSGQKRQQKPKVKKEEVESPQLAQLILKPNRQKLDINRDPFEPLFLEKPGKENSQGVDMLEDVKFLGLVRVEGATSALLKTKFGKRMYKREDKIREYQIVAISETEVVLKNDKRTIKIKRGMKK